MCVYTVLVTFDDYVSVCLGEVAEIMVNFSVIQVRFEPMTLVLNSQRPNHLSLPATFKELGHFVRWAEGGISAGGSQCLVFNLSTWGGKNERKKNTGLQTFF